MKQSVKDLLVEVVPFLWRGIDTPSTKTETIVLQGFGGGSRNWNCGGGGLIKIVVKPYNGKATGRFVNTHRAI